LNASRYYPAVATELPGLTAPNLYEKDDRGVSLAE
jgi:hypothetical protein